MSGSSRALLGCAAALLNQARIVDRLSRPLTASALVSLPIAAALVHPPRGLVVVAIVVAVAGLAEAYFAFRVGFDAALFRRAADGAENADFATTDAALTTLRLLPAGKCGRPVNARIAGARRLFVLQILTLTAQLAALTAGALTAGLWR